VQHVTASIENQVTLGRMPIPLLKGEIALVKRVHWTFWPAASLLNTSNGVFLAALAFNFKLADMEGAVSLIDIGTQSVFWAHYFVTLKLGTNTGFSLVKWPQEYTYPEPGFPVGGDQGVASFKGTGIPAPEAFICELYYEREQVGEARALRISSRTSFSKVT